MNENGKNKLYQERGNTSMLQSYVGSNEYESRVRFRVTSLIPCKKSPIVSLPQNDYDRFTLCP